MEDHSKKSRELTLLSKVLSIDHNLREEYLGKQNHHSQCHQKIYSCKEINKMCENFCTESCGTLLEKTL